MQKTDPKIKGIERCIRYAFMPNRLHLCGPENQADILEFYAKANESRKGVRCPKERYLTPLTTVLEGFETMYPYLKLIAAGNKSKDPFDEKVIEAYWVGNQALGNVGGKKLFNHLTNRVNLKKHLGFKDFRRFAENFNIGSLPHHNFHVLNIYRRTGKTKELHNLASYDACRISWGKVLRVDKGKLRVTTRPLETDGKGKIFEGDAIEKEILNEAEGAKLILDAKPGDYVSLHWSAVCEKLTGEQVGNLQRFTNLSLLLANSNLG